jgi:hypothetical protein
MAAGIAAGVAGVAAGVAGAAGAWANARFIANNAERPVTKNLFIEFTPSEKASRLEELTFRVSIR